MSGWNFTTPQPRKRGFSLFIYLLPYIEMVQLYDRWDFRDPDKAFVGDLESLAALGPNLLCPSEPESENPLDYGSRHIQGVQMPPRHIKVTSYAGCGGTRSYHPDSGFLRTDGIFFMAGPDSQPMPNQQPVRLADITDGTSNTLFFGERSRWDPNYDTFAAQGWDWEFRFYGNWCGASRLVLAHVTLSSYSPINYRLPFDYEHRGSAVPPANSAADFKYYIDLRICAFGSNHPAGANLCHGRRIGAILFREYVAVDLACFKHAAGRGGCDAAMMTLLRTRCSGSPAKCISRVNNLRRIICLTLAFMTLAGCGSSESSATVGGTLRLNGKPLDNCLITFLPEPDQADPGPHSTGVTDRQGAYRLRFADQQERVAVGWHRVTVQDLSVSTGVVRRDHGAVEAEPDDSGNAAQVRPSRIPENYASVSKTPFRKEVHPGHQVIDLDIQ